MGDIAEASLWGDINGRAMDCPEDWEDYAEETGPVPAHMIADEARMLLHWINEWADEEAPPTTAELLKELFPKLGKDQAQLIADGLQLLAAQAEED